MKPHSSHGNQPSWVASSGQPSVFANSSHKSYSSSHKYPSKQTQYGCFPNNYGNGGCYPSGGWNNGGYGGSGYGGNGGYGVPFFKR